MAAMLLAGAGIAHAQIIGTVAIVSDYNFRGISQSANDPAPQANIDWLSRRGWYLGLFASRIDLGHDLPRVEADLYGGYHRTLASGIGYEVGSIYYNYHLPAHSDFNYFELYAGGSYRWASAKVYYSPRFGGNAGTRMLGRSSSAYYFTSDATYPLPRNFSLIGHFGYSFGEYWDRERALRAARPYMDWGVGGGYLFRHVSLTLRWVDGSDLREGRNAMQNILSTRGRVILGVSTTLPWNAPDP